MTDIKAISQLTSNSKEMQLQLNDAFQSAILLAGQADSEEMNLDPLTRSITATLHRA